jgi:hypothetical protein
VDDVGNVYVAGENSSNAFNIPPSGPITQIIDSTGDGVHLLTNPGDVLSIATGGSNVFITGVTSNNAFMICR